MRFHTFVLRELFARPGPMLTSVLIILLGVGALVAIQTLSTYSELAVARELDSLGANVLILPRGVTVQDYYAADMQDEVLPEEYVMRLTLSTVQGVDNLSPKLTVSVPFGGRQATLTGILPKSEFQAKAAWAGAGIFARPLGCGAAAQVPVNSQPSDPRVLARKRVIDNLGDHEVLLGADMAGRHRLKEGDTIQLLGHDFAVLAILPTTGTVDDGRIFAHLHTVQELAGRGPVVNAIEVVGCCKQIAAGLVDNLRDLLPDAKVVTIAQVVQTQQTVNQMMSRLAIGLLGILMIVGSVSMASAMYSNVNERRREIGTMMALGATPGFVLRVFLGKAVLLGLVGGLIGAVLGTLVAVSFGPHLVNTVVQPLPWLIAAGTGTALLMTAAATYLPARRAARLDPCFCLREV
jgi:putative ABC transport system permease protein